MSTKHLKLLASNPQALRLGFFNGLGAPTMLFSDFCCPTVKVFGTDTYQLYRPATAADGLKQDWVRIGGDFSVAVKQHVKAA